MGDGAEIDTSVGNGPVHFARRLSLALESSWVREQRGGRGAKRSNLR